MLAPSDVRRHAGRPPITIVCQDNYGLASHAVPGGATVSPIGKLFKSRSPTAQWSPPQPSPGGSELNSAAAIEKRITIWHVRLTGSNAKHLIMGYRSVNKKQEL
jgi:hypothetical protein